MQLPKAMLKVIPKDYHDTSKGTLKLLWEEEWRAIGITQVGSPRQAGGGEKQSSEEAAADAALTESRLGTLRGPRARTAYSPLQVPIDPQPLTLGALADHAPPTGARSTTSRRRSDALVRPQAPCTIARVHRPVRAALHVRFIVSRPLYEYHGLRIR